MEHELAPTGLAFMRLCDVVDTLRFTILKYHLNKESVLADYFALSFRQQRVLVAIKNMTIDKPEGVSLKDLAARIHFSVPATSLLVNSLVQAKYLQRVRCSSDHRRVLISLTNAAVALYTEVCNVVTESFKDIFNAVPPKDAAVFFRTIRTLHEQVFQNDHYFPGGKELTE